MPRSCKVATRGGARIEMSRLLYILRGKKSQLIRMRGLKAVTNIIYAWVRQVATRKYVWIESLFPFTSFSNFSLQLMHAWIESTSQTKKRIIFILFSFIILYLKG